MFLSIFYCFILMGRAGISGDYILALVLSKFPDKCQTKEIDFCHINGYNGIVTTDIAFYGGKKYGITERIN